MTISHMNKRTLVSIFTGAGGLDIGFEQSGFSTLSALEVHPKYCETLARNKDRKIPLPDGGGFYFEDTVIINKDIRIVSGDILCRGIKNIDCVIGGPPCQSFSSAGRQLSTFDSRGALIYEYLRILTEIKPKVFLFENVRGLVTAKAENGEPGEVLIDLLKEFEKVGYNCKVALLNSADYGAYQRRVRCFIIGSRIAAAPDFPIPKFGKNKISGTVDGYICEKWNTLGDFLELYADNDEINWVRPTEELWEQLKFVPNGSGLKSKGRAEATRPGGHWGYRQGTFIADPTLPARTVTGSSSQDWIRLPDGTLRRLTKKEVSKLQGFPEQWEFCGSKSDQFQQIGNAVPVTFGEVLGQTLYDYLSGGYKNYPLENEIILPKDILENIRNTKYDSSKNGAYRVNAQANARKGISPKVKHTSKKLDDY